jgi:hypothetical protein
MSTFPEQVNLPLEAAARIVLQGLRIRLGRSLITVSGVLLGIMFLSSTLTTHLVKSGVAEEDRLRAEASRMVNFLRAEMGVLADRHVNVIATGDLTEAEVRFVRRLAREGLADLAWSGPIPSSLQTLRGITSLTSSGVSEAADAVVIFGGRDGFDSMRDKLLEVEFSGPVAMTRASAAEETVDGGMRLVSLTGVPTEAELDRAAAEARTARYRLAWIMVIALAVTMMGITNAMLMSVTERFREIGTMKCLGATSQLIRRIFLIESLLIGGTGSLAGALLGAAFAIGFHSIIYGFGMVLGSLAMTPLVLTIILSALGGIVLTVLAALYPAGVASSMVPADALRSNV